MAKKAKKIVPISLVKQLLEIGADRIQYSSGLKAAIPDETKMFMAHGCKCDVCGVAGKEFRLEGNRLKLYNANGTVMTVEHTTPKCVGGRNTLDNLRPLCKPCNTIWKNGFDQMLKRMCDIQLTDDMIVT